MDEVDRSTSSSDDSAGRHGPDRVTTVRMWLITVPAIVGIGGLTIYLATAFGISEWAAFVFALVVVDVPWLWLMFTWAMTEPCPSGGHRRRTADAQCRVCGHS